MAPVAFLPWVRQGAAATIRAADSLGPDQPAAASLTAALTINGSRTVTVPLQVRGPADVVGLDPAEIVRMQPPPGTVEFEPNHLAYVDFDRPDLPWLFTPAAAGGTARLRPWLCLVVVRLQAGVELLGPGAGPLPALRIAAPARPERELPDLDDCWAWAHAQVAAGDADPAAVRAALAGPTDVSLSRIIGSRLLEPDTTYLACVVPVFDVGRRAGLGLPVPDADLTGPHALAPAWSLTPPPAAVTVPAYAHWQFATGSGGDFASLAQRLRIQKAPAGLGSRPIDVSRPGFALPPAVPAGTTVPLDGALQPMTGPDTYQPWAGTAGDAFRAALAPILNEAGEQATAEPNADPLLGPTLYGRWHAGRPTVAPTGTAWYDQLNLDPRYRAVAAFGTRVVQEHQEALVAAAWEQAADLQAAGQRVRQLQLSLAVNVSLHARSFQPLRDDAAVRVTAPLFGRIHAAGGGGETATLIARLGQSPGVLPATGPVMRRLGRERGPLSRRVGRQGLARSATASWIGQVFTGVPIFLPRPFRLTTIELIVSRLPPPVSLLSYSEVRSDTVLGRGPLPTFHVVPEGQPVSVASPGHGTDSPAAAAFRTAAAEHLRLVDTGRPREIFNPPLPIPLTQVKTAVLAQLRPGATFAAFAAAAVSTGPTTTSPARVDDAGPRPGEVGIDTLLTAPVFHQPMYEPLRDLSESLLLPGLDTVEANRVVGLQTNRPFIESYLLGLNVELGRELVWRGYPTDVRATSFDQFWDFRTGGTPRADIAPVAEWGGNPLGGNPADPAATEPFVLLVRSDLLRRYPNATVYATRAVGSGPNRAPSGAAADEVMPAFRGSLPPDITFFGFDLGVGDVVGGAHQPGYYVVIAEHAGEPVFGLDVGAAPPGATHLDATAPAPPGLPPAGLQWGRNGAHVAGMLRRRPIRLAIHASQLVAGS